MLRLKIILRPLLLTPMQNNKDRFISAPKQSNKQTHCRKIYETIVFKMLDPRQQRTALPWKGTQTRSRQLPAGRVSKLQGKARGPRGAWGTLWVEENELSDQRDEGHPPPCTAQSTGEETCTEVDARDLQRTAWKCSAEHWAVRAGKETKGWRELCPLSWEEIRALSHQPGWEAFYITEHPECMQKHLASVAGNNQPWNKHISGSTGQVFKARPQRIKLYPSNWPAFQNNVQEYLQGYNYSQHPRKSKFAKSGIP